MDTVVRCAQLRAALSDRTLLIAIIPLNPPLIRGTLRILEVIKILEKFGFRDLLLLPSQISYTKVDNLQQLDMFVETIGAIATVTSTIELSEKL